MSQINFNSSLINSGYENNSETICKSELNKNNADKKKVHRTLSQRLRLSFRFTRKIIGDDNRDSENEIIQNNDNTAANNTTASSTLLTSMKNECDETIKSSSTTTDDNKKKQRVFRRSTWKKYLSRIAQQINLININGKPSFSTDRVPPVTSNYVWSSDQIPGVTGLKNHGNTCFMNAVLQCLSHTDILAEYFVLDQYKADLKRRNKINSKKFGTKGELTEQLAQVLKALWTCKNESDYSTNFKAVVDRYGSQFRSSTQHDAQEFLFWLLDKVHEDLNTATKRKYKLIKNNNGRTDEIIAAETLANHIRCNNSFVQAVFQAQFRSSLSCPRCHKQSNTFDPFHCISVQLPQLSFQAIFITVIYATQHPRQVKLGLNIPQGSHVSALREQINADTSIPLKRMIFTEITEKGFVRVFCDSYPMSALDENDSLYCIETPDLMDNTRELILLISNVMCKNNNLNDTKRFSTPFSLKIERDISYVDLQKQLLKSMQNILKPEVFTYTRTMISEMFRIRLQDPSADPDTYIDKNVEHPLFTEIIDLALSILPNDVGTTHIKVLLEWSDPDKYFSDITDDIVEHESVSQIKEKQSESTILTLEQCLEHYTRAETLSTEDAWRCPNCQEYLPVVKTLGLWSLPDILVIHFKRFRQPHAKGPEAAKLTTTVKFPLNDFDMSPHLAKNETTSRTEGIQAIPSTSTTSNSPIVPMNGEDNWSPWKRIRKRDNFVEQNFQQKQYLHQQMNNRYDLYAVCYHQGDTLETGHYTAACKNPYDHHWYKFDDQQVSQVPVEDIPSAIVNNEAYILFYQRHKIDIAECSGNSSTSSDHWVTKITSNLTNSTGASTANSLSGLNGDDRKELIDKDGGLSVLNEKSPSTTHSIKSMQSDSLISPLHGEVVNKATNTSTIESKNAKTLSIIELNSEIVKIEKTNEDNIVDVENDQIDIDENDDSPENVIIDDKTIIDNELDTLIKVSAHEEDINKNCSKKQQEIIINDIDTNTISNQTTIPCINGINSNTNNNINIGSNSNINEKINFNDVFRRDNIDRYSASSLLLRHHQKDQHDTISIIRSVSSCSKDNMLFNDASNHNIVDEIDDNDVGSTSTYLGSRSLWISPVTPHKFIAISPKN